MVVGVDIGQRNFGYAFLQCRPSDKKIRLTRIGTNDFKGNDVKETVHNMVRGFHNLLSEISFPNITVAIELQGKMMAQNRICQHAICTYLDTVEILSPPGATTVAQINPIPQSRFVEPRDKFRVSAANGQLVLLPRNEIAVLKTHGSRKSESIQRAKQLIPLLLERPEEALGVQESMNDHMADALLTGLYVALRWVSNTADGADDDNGEKLERKRKRMEAKKKESIFSTSTSTKKPKSMKPTQWSFV